MKIKCFSRNDDSPADYFNSEIEKWQSSFLKGIEIISVHTTSNSYGWMDDNNNI